MSLYVLFFKYFYHSFNCKLVLYSRLHILFLLSIIVFKFFII